MWTVRFIGHCGVHRLDQVTEITDVLCRYLITSLLSHCQYTSQFVAASMGNIPQEANAAVKEGDGHNAKAPVKVSRSEKVLEPFTYAM